MPDRPGLRPQATPDTARVFFALWPEAPLQACLAKEARRLHGLLGGRQTRAETLHLTLLFIGQLARDRLPELQAAARQIRVPAFEAVFDQADCWRHNRIAYLGSGQVPEALLDLVKALEDATAAQAIAFDQRPYKAHITLVRHARCTRKSPAEGRAAMERIPIPPPAPITWQARDFSLMESRPDAEGVRYVLLERYPLL